MSLSFYKGDSVESKFFKSIVIALAFTTSYSMASAQQMVPQSPSNRPPQTNSKSSIARSTNSGKVTTSDIPSSETNLNQNQNNFPSKKQKIDEEQRNKNDRKIKSDGSVRNDYRTKPNPKGKIKNLNTESLNQHPIPTRANDPSRDGVRVK